MTLSHAGAVLISAEAFGVRDADALVRIWRKAVAFGVERDWIGRLEDVQRRSLSNALVEALVAIADQLSWQEDLRLTAFHSNERRGIIAHPGEFASRTDQGLWVKWAMNHSREGLATAFAFGQMATSVALAGESFQVGNLLTRLPFGRAYFAAVEAMQVWRPTIIATLLSYPDFACHGAIALADWADRRNVQGHGSMVMQDEWLELTCLARRLMLFQDGGPDYAEVLALAVHDEKRDSVPLQNPYGRSSVPPLAERFKPWVDRMQDPEHARRATDAIVTRLLVATSVADFVVALRILQIVEQKHIEQAVRVATAIADTYVSRFSLTREGRNRAPDLSGHGGLLGTFQRVLRERLPDKHAAWIVPFDVAHFVVLAQEPLPDIVTSSSPTPMFDVPTFVRTHATNLLAATGFDQMDRLTGVRAFVQLFEQTHGKLEQDPWDGRWRSESDITPILVRLGRQLAQLPEDQAREFIDRMVDAKLEANYLAELIWGLGPGSALAAALSGRARRYAEQELAPQRLAIGPGNAAAIAFYAAGMPEIAEQYAKQVLDIFASEPPYPLEAYREQAVRVLLGSWTAQKKWSELNEADVPTSDFHTRILIENLQAVAHLEQGHGEQALARIDKILTQQPDNAMALAKATTAHALRSDWESCIVACSRARQVLREKTPDEVWANEARAFYNTQRFREAASAIEQISPEAARSASMMTLRVALATATAPTVAGIAEDLKALDITEPRVAAKLRTVLAPLSDVEIGGGWFTPGSAERRFWAFEERCAPFGRSPERFLIDQIAAAARRLAERPALMVTLDENQLTGIFCDLLVPMERVGVYAEVLVPGGWGPSEEGITDFAVSEMGDQGIGRGRRIVRGEAKIWDGPAWMEKGLRQIFATGNTGQEVLLCLLIYSRKENLATVLSSATKMLNGFGIDGSTPYGIIGETEEVSPILESAVRIFKSLHRERLNDEASPVRTLLTVVVDIASTASRNVRIAERG